MKLKNQPKQRRKIMHTRKRNKRYDDLTFSALIVGTCVVLILLSLLIISAPGGRAGTETAPEIHDPVPDSTEETAASQLRSRIEVYQRARPPEISTQTVQIVQIPEAQAPRFYTDEELQILANTVWHEARYCTDRHQQLVAAVVMNRVADVRFPDTVRDVVTQPGQYGTGTYAANLPDLEAEDAEMQRCILNAREALEGRVKCPADVVFQAEFRQGTGVYEEIAVDTGYFRSTTYFCYG